MISTIINSLLLIAIGLIGFFFWNEVDTHWDATCMLMPVFFGGAFLICLAFRKQHFRHGLYGGLIFALLGIVSALIRIYQFGHFHNLAELRMHIILAMLLICIIQTVCIWKQVQRDRASAMGL